MGKPWNAEIATVTIPLGDPKDVTLIVPFYENGDFLRTQIARWNEYPGDLRRHLRLIVVDDGSPSQASAVLERHRPEFPFRLFRISVDIRWNWLAARNIGFHHAADGWCLVTDMDHVIPSETMEAAIYGEHDTRVIYGFSRQEHTGAVLGPHPNSWLMTRAMFWTVGGYDEALSGFYGTDGDWRRRMAAVAPIQILADRLIRHEHLGDSSTTRYKRKQPEDAAVSRIVAKRGKHWRPKSLSFPYAEVDLEARCLAS